MSPASAQLTASRVKPLHSGLWPDRLSEREAAEERRVEVLQHLREVLYPRDEALHRVLLLVGEAAFHRRQRGDLELESGDRRLSALDAGEKYRVRALDLVEEPVKALRVAGAGGVPDVLRGADRDADERVRALQPAMRRVDHDRPRRHMGRRQLFTVHFHLATLLSRHKRSLCRCCVPQSPRTASRIRPRSSPRAYRARRRSSRRSGR